MLVRILFLQPKEVTKDCSVGYLAPNSTLKQIFGGEKILERPAMSASSGALGKEVALVYSIAPK